MPPDHLTSPTGQLANRVEALITGGAQPAPPSLDQNIDPYDLAEAVETYQAAGRAALQRRDEHAWFQARITPIDWADAEAAFADQIAPQLDRIDSGNADWWYLRKHPCWRIRVRTPDHAAVRTLLCELAAAGVIAGWRPGIYEPETAAFGGATAMEAIHDLFCADSRAVLAYARHPAPMLGRRELSLLLITALWQHAGLDRFEAGDLFHRVARLRPPPPAGDAERIAALAAQVRPLLEVSIHPDTAPFTDPDTAGYARPWLAAFDAAGRELRDADAAGQLRRGLRAVLAQIVIFHWNRLGLSAPAQGVLAHAATTAILPPELN
jgi:thiopeptide-type bacteriocin biosynthesis protein